ncbi:helix-turn-helix domain-containing protein [Actinomycetes bacterium KLBMP 9797]
MSDQRAMPSPDSSRLPSTPPGADLTSAAPVPPSTSVSRTAAESLGALLAGLRLRRGWSQLRVAEQLCAAAGVPTVSRHEISRWERGERVPGDFWLGWLAEVLDAPRAELAAAATAARRGPAGRVARQVPGDASDELLRLARAWVADPVGWPGGHATGPAPAPALGPLSAAAARLSPDAGAAPPVDAATRDHGAAGGTPAVDAPARHGAGAAVADDTGTSVADDANVALRDDVDAVADNTGALRDDTGAVADDAGALAAATAELRRLDDLVGGADLAGPATRRLDRALAALPGATQATRRHLLTLVADAAQLTGWVAADAGDPVAALSAYRIGLIMAATAGDRPLAAHVLGSASHLLAASGDPRVALDLARAALAGAGRSAPAALRALLLHRLAFAAAGCGERRTARAALAAAQTAAQQRDPAQDPPWLYWLDSAELSAMTGRCLAALGRPLRAEPLLSAAVVGATGPRTAALYGAWLARACLDLGEIERACDVAGAALLDAVRAGSTRAAAEVDALRIRLTGHDDALEARDFAELAAECRPYLPAPARARPASSPRT